MNKRLARGYAHDVVLRAIESALEDEEWIEVRLPNDADRKRVMAEVNVLQQWHLDRHRTLPPQSEEASWERAERKRLEKVLGRVAQSEERGPSKTAARGSSPRSPASVKR